MPSFSTPDGPCYLLFRTIEFYLLSLCPLCCSPYAKCSDNYLQPERDFCSAFEYKNLVQNLGNTTTTQQVEILNLYIFFTEITEGLKQCEEFFPQPRQAFEVSSFLLLHFFPFLKYCAEREFCSIVLLARQLGKRTSQGDLTLMTGQNDFSAHTGQVY